jgi:hypothetical protein
MGNNEMTTNTEMLSIHRKALTALSKLNLINLRLNVEMDFRSEEEGSMCSITVFTVDCGNCTFNFYNFTSFKKNKENLERAISAIKSDSFHEVEHIKFNH